MHATALSSFHRRRLARLARPRARATARACQHRPGVAAMVPWFGRFGRHIRSRLVKSRPESPFGAGCRRVARTGVLLGRLRPMTARCSEPSRLSSRSSQSNSVPPPPSPTNPSAVRTIQADQNPSWWAATLHGVVLPQSDFKIRYVVDFPRSGFKNLDCFPTAGTGRQRPVQNFHPQQV